MMSKVTSLKNIKVVDWVMIARPVGGHSRVGGFCDLDLRISMAERSKPTKSGKLPKFFYLRFGGGLMSKLGFENGDQIALCYDKADHKSMMIVKSPNGYALALEKNTEKNQVKIYKATIPGDWSVFNAFGGVKLSYTIDKEKKVFFRLEI